MEVVNYRIFHPALMKTLAPEVKQTLANNLINAAKYIDYDLIKIVGQPIDRLNRIYQEAMNDLFFGDFNSYLNCAKIYFTLLEEFGIDDEEAIARRNELYSILVNHLNRYPSTKVYSISKAILANATEHNDDAVLEIFG